MKQKYTKPEISSVEFKMEQGYAASQGMLRLGSFEDLTWSDIYNDNGSQGEGYFGRSKTTGYFGGSTDDWD